MKRFLILLILALSLNGEAAPPQYSLNTGVLGRLISANFNSTSDQVISVNCSSNNYIIKNITVKNASISLTTAAGGFYTATSKGGTAIVAATQVYSGLTASTKFINLTLASTLGTDIRTETSLYFSLSTAQGAAATADIFIEGSCYQ
jgi:hypothetical protein